MKRKVLLAAVAVTAALGVAPAAFAQASDQYLGQLMMVGFSFCPRGWVESDGQIMSIQQNSALFSLYGTTYGGNGTSNFALPDLRGRVPAHTGQGPGLAPVIQGQPLGTDSTTLQLSQMPMHNHALMATTSGPDNGNPNNALLATFPGTNIYSTAGAANVVMKPTAIGMAGNSLPFDQHQPTLVLRWCVSLSGVFPSRP